LAAIGLATEPASPSAAERAPSPPADARRTLAVRTQSVAPAGAEQATTATYASDRVLIAAPDTATLAAIARRHGSSVAAPVGRSGYGALAVPTGRDPGSFLQGLRADSLVQDVAREGIVRGAGKGKGKPTAEADAPLVEGTTTDDTSSDDTPTLAPTEPSTTDSAVTEAPSPEAADTLDAALRWHHELAGVPAAAPAALDQVVVAVLDSGVAYLDHNDQGTWRAAAPGLATVEVVAPRDLIEDDLTPQDAHQHGTHIASIAVAQGELPGVAAGARLMPVRVLDANNQGRELDLVEGIHWAIDNGADVINLSLSFCLDYVPSVALQSALAEAHEAGIVVVGAVGNLGAGRISWPAAARTVLAVGAAAPASSGPYAAPYSNHSHRVDLLAPGGLLTEDGNGDGLADGIVAETFDPASPDQIGPWMMAGSSQAAAVASGAVAWLLGAGASPDDTLSALRQTAVPAAGKPYSNGSGAGTIHLGAALDWLADGGTAPDHDVHVSVLPFLNRQGGNLLPTALVLAVDSDGSVLGRATVMGRVHDGTTSQGLETTTGRKDGIGWLEAGTVADTGSPQAWAFEVDLVVHGDHVHRPGGMIRATESLEVLTAALDSLPAADGASLAVHWDEGSAVDVIGPTAASTSITNMGSGLSSSPLGVVLNAPAVQQWSTVTTLDVDLDGSGLSSSPLGLMPLRQMVFDGSGLSSSPLGLDTSLRLLSFEGSGLSSSPLGLTATAMLLDGEGVDLDGIAIDDQPVFLAEMGATNPQLEGTSLGSQLESGGWVTAEGYEAASLVMPEAEALPTGSSGAGAVPLD
jgi:hypothetical protein